MGITKTKAFGIHLAISLVIFLILSWFLVFRWFPQDLFFIDGGWQGMRIIAAVDLVLGPVLTLIFYKQGKPGLKFDISMIALIQIFALIYGVYAAHQQSVVAIAFVEKRFVTVSQAALKQGNAEMLEAEGNIQSLDKFDNYRPAQIFVVPPTRENYGAYLASLLNGMPEMQERSHTFKPLELHIDEITQFRVTAESVGDQEKNLLKAVEHYQQQNGLEPDERYFFRLKARYGSGFVVLDPKIRAIVDIVKLEK